MLYAYNEVATEIPRSRSSFFQDVIRRLGPDRTEEIRAEFNRIIDHLEPDKKTGKRFIYSSSSLGSGLAPWPMPLAYISNIWSEESSSWIFGLFLWECLMHRDEGWMLYDPNISQKYRKRGYRDLQENEILGKGYFEVEPLV